MNTVHLKFTSLETLAAFIRYVNAPYYAEIASLKVKGRFTPEMVKHATALFQAKATWQASDTQPQ